MPEFWRSAGYQLVARTGDNKLLPTDDWLRAYLHRPELAPVEESCKAERALYACLVENHHSAVEAATLDSLQDSDARSNYQAFLTFRDRVLSKPSIEAAYLDMVERGISGMPPLFLEQLVHLQLRHILRDTADPIHLRAAELLFREQKVTIQDGRVMVADDETVTLHASGQNFGSLGRLLVEADTKPATVDLDVLEETNSDLYWQRSDRFDMVLDLGFTRPGLDGLCRVLEAWVRHFREIDINIQPVQQISDPKWIWHVGLDAEASAFLNDLYEGTEIDEARQARLLSLFRLEFQDPGDMLQRVRGRPVYLGLMMNEQSCLKLKPQNILINLPLAARS
ncbi:MAG: DUF6352 family protein [Geminicoccaceae bacterium]